MIFTLRDMKEALANLTEEQLDQQAEIMITRDNPDLPFPLHPIISFETIKYFLSSSSGVDSGDTTRSSVDNEHHPEHFVFLMDYNMFSPDGTIGFDLETGESVYGASQKDMEVEDEFGDTFGKTNPQ